MARTKQIIKEKKKFIPKEYTDDDGVNGSNDHLVVIL